MKPTRISKLLNIRYPIIQGGMAWASSAGLVAAVSDAGGLGLLGSATMTPAELSAQIDLTRQKTDKTFGVNIVIMADNPEEKTQICIDKKVAIVVTAAGNPNLYTRALKEAGIIVGHVVPSAKLAVKSGDAGVDFIIAESTEAGGHDGAEEISTAELITLVKNAITLPLVAAGGIVNGYQIATIMSKGADGVQMGTRFVATKECDVHERFKRGIIDAGPEGTLFIARNYKPQRVLKNPFADKIKKMEEAGASPEDLRQAYGPGRGYKGCVEGNWEEGYFNCGQGAALIDKVLPVGELFINLINEYNEAAGL